MRLFLMIGALMLCGSCDAANEAVPAAKPEPPTVEPAGARSPKPEKAKKGFFSLPDPVRPKLARAVMHPDGEHSREFEVFVDEPFDRSTIYYHFRFTTKSGKQLEDQGIFVSNGVTGVNATKSVRHNVFRFIGRHDSDERREIVKDHVKAGNIESVTVKLAVGHGGFNEGEVFTEATFKDL